MSTGVKCEIPVEWNDVFFSLHGFLLTFITIVQCIFFERAGQRVSYIAMGLIGAAAVATGIYLALALTAVKNWLQPVVFLSSLKLWSTPPQATPQRSQTHLPSSTARRHHNR